jgi:hypothetical protein
MVELLHRTGLRRLGSTALLLVAVAAPSYAGKAEEKFQPSDSYVAVSGPFPIRGDRIRVGVGLVQPPVLAGMPGDPALPCSATVDLRVLDADSPTATPLAERGGLELTPAKPELLEFTDASTSDRKIYIVIVLRQALVDSRTCVLRGRAQIQDGTTGQTQVDKEVWRQDFGQVKADRKSDV